MEPATSPREGITGASGETHAVAISSNEAVGVVGHRACIVQSWTSVPGKYLLRSITAFDVWMPGEAMRDTAHCGQHIDEHNDAGIWAFKTQSDCEREDQY